MFSIASLTPVLIALVADPLVRVEGASPCPTAEQVQERLERLLPARPDDVSADRARVDIDPEGIRLELRRADGSLVGDKRLSLGASCAEMAEAVAVVIAIWERPLRPGLVPPLETVGGAARPSPPSESSPTAAETSGTPQPHGSGWHLEAGAAVQGRAPHAVPGAMLEAALRKAAGNWGPRLSFEGAWWTQSNLGPGHVSWTRFGAGLGLIHGWAGNHFFFDIHEQFQLAMLVAEGHGYDQVGRTSALDPGVGAGVRLGVSLAATFRLWLDMSIYFWPTDQEVRVEGLEPTIGPARVEGSLSLGGTFLGSH